VVMIGLSGLLGLVSMRERVKNFIWKNLQFGKFTDFLNARPFHSSGKNN